MSDVVNVVKRGPLAPIDWIRGISDRTTAMPAAPAPVEMPTIDAEAARRARLRAQRRMVAQSQGRESTILGGSSTTLGGQ